MLRKDDKKEEILLISGLIYIHKIMEGVGIQERKQSLDQVSHVALDIGGKCFLF